MLQLFSRFMMDIYIKENNTTRVLGNRCINCNKLVGCEFKYQMLTKVITVFVSKSAAFQNVCLSCIIESKEQVMFDIEDTCPTWNQNRPWYNNFFFRLNWLFC